MTRATKSTKPTKHPVQYPVSLSFIHFLNSVYFSVCAYLRNIRILFHQLNIIIICTRNQPHTEHFKK